MHINASPNAPSPVGPYSLAVRTGSLVFFAGQIPLDPATGQMIQGDIKAETERVLQNLGAVLKTAECTFESVVKTTIYLTDLGDFQTVNEVYSRYFKSNFPARTTVQVAALPKGARVEIDAIATTVSG